MKTGSYITSRMGNHVPLLLFLLIFLLAVLPAHSKSTPVTAPGKSFYGTGMRLCDVDASGNCHNSKYALEVAKFGSGGLAAAVLTFLAFIVFLPGRTLCNGFGGKEPSYGCCCPSTAASREYTRREILYVKFAVTIIAIPIIIGVAIGFESNSEISSSLSTVTATLVSSGDNITSILEQTRDLLLSMSITSGYADVINSSVQSAISIDNNMHNARNTIHKYDNIRKSIMIVGFVFSLSLVLAGIVCAIFNMRLVAFFFGMIGLLVLTTVWISFGIHLVADKFTYDVCVDVDLLISNSTSGNTTSVLKSGALANLWNCGQNSNFYHLETLVNEAIGVAANDTCVLRSSSCYDAVTQKGFPNWVCSSVPACGSDTLQEVTDAQHMTIIDGTTNRTLADCATNCSNSDQKNTAIGMVTAVNEYENYTLIYQYTVLPLITCQYAADVLAGVRDPLCVTLNNSLFGVAVSNLVVGIFYIAFIICMVVGYKRFESFSGGIV